MGRLTGRTIAIAIAVLAAVLLTGCAAAPEQSAPVAPKTGLIVMIGDSIMRGYGLSSTDPAWPHLLADDRGLTIDNLACDGAGFLAVGASAECGGSYEVIVSAAIDLRPATVIIEGSDNDFGLDSDALATATTHQIARLREALPDATIIGLSTISGAAAAPGQLAVADGQVRQAISSVGGKFLTIGQPYSDNPAWMQDDQEHPTASGQLAITRAVEHALDAARITLR